MTLCLNSNNIKDQATAPLQTPEPETTFPTVETTTTSKTSPGHQHQLTGRQHTQKSVLAKACAIETSKNKVGSQQG